MPSLMLYLVLIMWSCGGADTPRSLWNVRTVAEYNDELAKLSAMRAHLEEATDLDASCTLQTFTAEAVDLETLRRVVRSHPDAQL